MKRQIAFGMWCVVVLAAGRCLAADPPAVQEKAPPAMSQAQREKQFADTMSGATLVGRYTDRGRGDDGYAKDERYVIESVTRLPMGDYWLFRARIQYGNHDATVPMPLRVLWAGDTPVITLDKVPIPGFGTFSARVMIHDGKYAGMWDGGDHGGTLQGKIVKEEAPAKPQPSDKK